MLRLDDLGNGYSIYQDPAMFCFGIDAVLLAHYPVLSEDETILDMGCGFAPIPFILRAEAEKKDLHVDITGIEIQPFCAETAKKSLAYNGINEGIKIIEGDIREAGVRFGAASFSLITCNPPYMPKEKGLISEKESKAIARTEVLCTLEDVMREARTLLKNHGRLCMVHRPGRIGDIFAMAEKHRLTIKRMRMVYPAADKIPSMVLVEAVKGAKAFLTVEKPLIIYGEDGGYTDEIKTIYGLM